MALDDLTPSMLLTLRTFFAEIAGDDISPIPVGDMEAFDGVQTQRLFASVVQIQFFTFQFQANLFQLQP